MFRNICRFIAISTLAAVAAGSTINIQAADTTPAEASTTPKAKKAKAQTYAGKVTAVDKIQKTVTVTVKGKEEVFQVTSASRFTKITKPATLDDLAVGEQVTVRARTKAGGKPEVVSVRTGTKSTGKGKTKKAKTTAPATTTTTPAAPTNPAPAPAPDAK
jgi:hypothetical protein